MGSTISKKEYTKSLEVKVESQIRKGYCFNDLEIEL